MPTSTKCSQAARTRRPGGRLIVVDFAAHHEEAMREEFAHRRLGFADDEIEDFLKEAGLEPLPARHVEPGAGEARQLTVAIWLARDPRIISDDLSRTSREFA